MNFLQVKQFATANFVHFPAFRLEIYAFPKPFLCILPTLDGFFPFPPDSFRQQEKTAGAFSASGAGFCRCSDRLWQRIHRISPFSRMAGRTESTRYTVISSTLPMVTRPRIRKISWTTVSNRLLFAWNPSRATCEECEVRNVEC